MMDRENEAQVIQCLTNLTAAVLALNQTLELGFGRLMSRLEFLEDSLGEVSIQIQALRQKGDEE